MYKDEFHLFTSDRTDIYVHIDCENTHVLIYADKCTSGAVPRGPTVLDASPGLVK